MRHIDNNLINKNLNNVLEELTKLPAMKDYALKELSNAGFNSKDIELLLKGENATLVLDKDELSRFIHKIHDMTKDNRVNPDKLLKEKTKENTKTKPEAKTMYEMPNLYHDYDFKLGYVDHQYPESQSTKKAVMTLFRKSAPMEKELGKDLYDFDIGEMEKFIRSLKITTIRSLHNTISKIEVYINYALSKGMTKYEMNSAEKFDNKKVLEPLLDDAEIIFDMEEIMAIAKTADNAQDGVIVALLFDGLSRMNKFEELVELEKEDIDFMNMQVMIDGRIIKFSKDTIELIKDALSQEQYVSVSGDKVRRYSIASGNHVLRGVRNNSKVKAQLISQRILRISEITGYEHLNATNIAFSGMVYYSLQEMKNGTDIENAIKIAMDRFGAVKNEASIFRMKSRINEYMDSLERD